MFSRWTQFGGRFQAVVEIVAKKQRCSMFEKVFNLFEYSNVSQYLCTQSCPLNCIYPFLRSNVLHRIAKVNAFTLQKP